MQSSITNPYVYDQPVTGEKFFGRENEIQQIEKALNKTGQWIVIIGHRGIGKTSLLYELRNRLSADQFATVYIRRFAGAKTLPEFWRDVAQQIASEVMMNRFEGGANSVQQDAAVSSMPFDEKGELFQRDFLQRVYNALRSPSQRLVLMIDDFDFPLYLHASGGIPDPILEPLLRISTEEPRIAIMLAGMFRREWQMMYPHWTRDQSGFLALSVLNRESASRLIISSSQDIKYDAEAVTRILELTNGYPRYTLMLCSMVSNAARASSTADVPVVMPTLVDSVVFNVLRQEESIFEGMWENVSFSERPVVSALAELVKDDESAFASSLISVRLHERKQDIPADQLAAALKNLADMQILQEVEGGYRFLVPLFGLWIKERKPLQKTIEESKAQESAQQTEQRNEILVNFALNDRPVGEDKLGYDDYAKAFAQVLANPDTKTPLTIGIYGSWGMGKSFLMEKIKEQLKAAKRAMEEERKKKGLEIKDYHDFHFVHFNAWVYSGSENLWAGLVTKLYSEVEKYFGSLRLKWHLLIYNIRKSYKRMIMTLAIYGILGVLIAVLWDYKSVQESWDALQIATKTLAGGSLVVALGSILKTGYDLFSKLVLARSEQLAAFSSRKDFKDKIGFMADIKAEVTHIGAMLNAGKRSRPVRFVIFIDDLDRCPPAKAVEVLEAIMLLLADDDGIPFIIFLGIDARVIVKAIEERYGKVLTDAGITGYEYLDKIVQIPFRIPPANEEALKNYVESLLWRSDKERKEAKEIKEREEKEKEEKEERERKEIEGKTETGETRELQGAVGKTESGEAVEGAAADSQTQTVGVGAVAASPDQKLPAQSDQVARESPKIPEVKIQSIEVPFKEEEQMAFKDFSRYYTPNPRRIKRIVNIYRIVRLLAGEQNAEFRRKMIKWVILSEQWPYRVAWVLQKIEDEYQLSHDLGATLSLWSVFESVQQRVAEGAEAFANLDGDKEVFEVFAKLEPLITVGDMKRLRTYTFNLNPALQSEVIKAATVKLEEENLPKQMA